MNITTYRNWELVDATNGKDEIHVLEPGTYEVEEIDCPLGHPCKWYVLKGTRIGMAVGAMRDYGDLSKGGLFKIDFDFPLSNMRNYIVSTKTKAFVSGNAKFINDNVFERIFFSEETALGSDEAIMEWSEVCGETLVKLVCYDFPILLKFADVLEKLEKNCSIAEFISILESCGFVDLTE